MHVSTHSHWSNSSCTTPTIVRCINNFPRPSGGPSTFSSWLQMKILTLQQDSQGSYTNLFLLSRQTSHHPLQHCENIKFFIAQSYLGPVGAGVCWVGSDTTRVVACMHIIVFVLKLWAIVVSCHNNISYTSYEGEEKPQEEEKCQKYQQKQHNSHNQSLICCNLHFI